MVQGLICFTGPCISQFMTFIIDFVLLQYCDTGDKKKKYIAVFIV